MRHSQVWNFTLFRVAPHFHLLLPPIDDDDGWHCCFRIIIFSVDSASAPLFSRISGEYKLILTFHCVVFGCLLLLLLKWHTTRLQSKIVDFSTRASISHWQRKKLKELKIFSFPCAIVVFHYFCLIFILRTHKESYCEAHMSFRKPKKKRITFVLFFSYFLASFVTWNNKRVSIPEKSKWSESFTRSFPYLNSLVISRCG